MGGLETTKNLVCPNVSQVKRLIYGSGQ